MLVTYVYTCQNCQHTWNDARAKQFADAPVKKGCASCGSNDITFERKKSKTTDSNAPFIGDPVRVGVTKKDKGFNEVLHKIKEAHPGGTIEVD